MREQQLKCILILLGINIFFWLPLILKNGIIIQRDFNFPVFPENFIRYYYPTWNDYTSKPNLEQMIRLPMRLPFLLLVKVGVSVSVILKLLIVSTTALLSISMYLFLHELSKRYDLKINQNIIIFSSLLFAFNPVSLQFLWEISLLISIAILPILLSLSMTEYDRPFRFILKGAFLLLFSLGHPFVFIINFIIWIIFTIIIQLKLGSKVNKSLYLRFLGICILFILLFSWYILPYITNPLSAINLGRQPNLKYSTFELVSDNNLQKILTLERDKFFYVKTYDSTNFGITLFHFLSLALVVSLAISAVVFKLNRKYILVTLFFLCGYLASTFLAFGSKSPFGGVYYLFISKSILGWIFRSPLKFQLYQMFFIFSLFPIGVSVIFRSIFTQRIRFMIYFLLVFLFIGVAGYGIYDANFNSMNPISLPTQFYNISTKLENLNDPYKVMWYPRYNERPASWSLGHMISPFDMKSSKKPTYDTFWNYNYVNYLLYEYPYKYNLFKSDYFYDFLASIGVKYIVFHNDRGYPIDNKILKEILEKTDQKVINLLYNNGDWYLFSINKKTSDYLSIKLLVIGVTNDDTIYKLANKEIAVLNVSQVSGYENRLLNIFYIFEAESDLHRSNAKVIKNINASNGELIAFGENGKAWQDVEIIKNGTYRIALKGIGEFNIKIGDNSFILKPNTLNFTYSPLLYLDEGKYRLEITPLNKASKLDVVWLYSTETDQTIEQLFEIKEKPAKIINYTKINPTLWKVKVNATKPFMLSFAEAYDPLWEARVYKDGKLVEKVKSIPLYSVINGFWINETGNLEVVIRYKPQDWFETGLMISATTFIACIGYIFYDWRKGKEDK